jgi:tRNA (cytidine/uridine-2'-O-)-methyltransferase
MRLALYQPEIAGNVGTIIRTCAAFGVAADIVEPCGFPFSDRALARAGMDYVERASVTRHADWASFMNAAPGRIVLFSTRAETALHDFAFTANDSLLLGQESAGVPDAVRDACAASIRIAMVPGLRSLNVAVAAGIALHEALRQTGLLNSAGPAPRG